MKYFLVVSYAALLAASFVLGVSEARAQMQGPVIFDNEATQGFASHQVPGNTSGADNGVGATIMVSANTPITGFGLETYQQSGGDLKFVIYDETTQTYPVVTATKSFGTAYFNFAQSPYFVFTLLAGHTYDLGAISDADTYYAYGYAGDGNGTATYTQNGITAPIENILLKNYANPTVNPVTAGSYNGDNFHGTAQFALEIYGVAPEPTARASILGGFGLLLAMAVCHRCRKGHV